MPTAALSRRFLPLLGAAVLTATVLAPTGAQAAVTTGPWSDTSLPAAERAQLLVDVLTLDEKIDLLIQTGGPGLPQYGVPAIRARDASNGLSNANGSTALPVGLALASTFDAALAEQYGAVAGQQVRESGLNSAAAPTIDLSRTPWGGRNWEGYGEDPYLSGILGSAAVTGIQSADVFAEVKHYNAYNSESRRGHVDVLVDERTLQEIYTRPWEPAVRNAGAGSVMCSFNKVNGEFACGNNTLLNEILKGQLGFQGFVQTDFNAAHGFEDYAAGLDTSGEQLTYSGDALRAAVADGRVSEERVTDAARRVLLVMFATGVIDNPPVNSFVTPAPALAPISAASLEQGNIVAGQTGDEGTVLLKNDSLLPLSDDIDSIAVIGSDADVYIDGGGSAAVTTPTNLVTMLDGITDRAGDGVDVRYAQGTDFVGTADTLPGPAPVPSGVLQNVQATYRGGIYNDNGPVFLSRQEQQINWRSGLSADVGNNTSQVPGVGFPTVLVPVTATFTATLNAPATGTYTLALTSLGTAQLYIDDQLVLTNDAPQVGTTTVDVPLTAGTPANVRVVYATNAPNQFDGSLNDQPGAMLRLGWIPPQGVVSPGVTAAAELAADSDVAVVVVRDYTGEAADRGNLTLPQGQDALIEAVAAANPRTIVVLATSGAVLMPWLDQVPSVIEAWYGGQVQGQTLARVLYGDVNPSGSLPVTFPATEDQPVQAGVSNPFDYVEELSPTTEYMEGINVGYRGYVANGLDPLFAFGAGLSYTSFDYANLVLPPAAPTSDPGTATTATVDITNTGDIAGTETVQLYVRQLPTDVPTAPLALAGAARVTLEPGQTQTVSIPIDRRSLQYWDVEQDQWVMPTGEVSVAVGSASDDLRVEGTLSVPAPDVTAPTVTITPDPAQPTGTNGWYRGPVTLTVAAQDDRDPAPRVEVSVNGAAFAPATGPITLDKDGAYVVQARATDASGNTATVELQVKIDQTAPAVTARKVNRFQVALTATDATSGVALIEYRTAIRIGRYTVTGPWRPYTRPIIVLSGLVGTEFRATDQAGNTSAVQSYRG